MTKPRRWDRWQCPHCHKAVTTHIDIPEAPGHRCEQRDETGRARGWVRLERTTVVVTMNGELPLHYEKNEDGDIGTSGFVLPCPS